MTRNLLRLLCSLLLVSTACADTPENPLPDAALPGDTTTDSNGDQVGSDVPDTAKVDADASGSDDGGGIDLPDTPLSDVTDTSLPDVPIVGCPQGCDDGAVCLDNTCVPSCGDVQLTDLMAALAPGVTVVDNICIDTSDVWAFSTGLNGAIYEVRASPGGANTTNVGLYGWKWWELDGPSGSSVIQNATVSGSVDLWQVFPGRFLKLSENGLNALWGYAAGAAGGNLHFTNVETGAATVINSPGLYGGTIFSSFLLSTASGTAGTNAGPGGYYYHVVLGIGGPLVSGLGTAVGAIDVHKNQVMLVTGYSDAWPDCGGTVPDPAPAGQRTYAIPLSLVVERYTAASLPIDLLCEGQLLSVASDYSFLVDGRLATRDFAANFELTGLSVHYWQLSGSNEFLLGQTFAITIGNTFEEISADPHSTKLLLRYRNGYLVVEGPPTQDPVIPPDTPDPPDAGPEAAPDGPSEGVVDTQADGGDAESVLDASDSGGVDQAEEM